MTIPKDYVEAARIEGKRAVGRKVVALDREGRRGDALGHPVGELEGKDLPGDQVRVLAVVDGAARGAEGDGTIRFEVETAGQAERACGEKQLGKGTPIEVHEILLSRDREL